MHQCGRRSLYFGGYHFFLEQRRKTACYFIKKGRRTKCTKVTGKANATSPTHSTWGATLLGSSRYLQRNRRDAHDEESLHEPAKLPRYVREDKRYTGSTACPQTYETMRWPTPGKERKDNITYVLLATFSTTKRGKACLIA